MPSFSDTIKKELLSVYSLIFIFIISLIYFSISVFLLNNKLVLSSIFGNYPLNFKFNILFQLLMGSYSAFSFYDFILLIITSVLVGANILLIYKTIKSLRAPGTKLSFAVGGSTLLGIFVAGCSSCGFSVLSLLGLTGALSFLPLKGLAIHLLVIALLLFSFFYSIKTYHQKIICKIK